MVVKKSMPDGREESVVMANRLAALTGSYFRFTRVRYAGRFERGKKTSG